MFSLAAVALLSACGSSGGSTATSTSTPTSASKTTAPAIVAAPALTLPKACSDLPVSLISTDLGGITASQTLADKATSVTCEWINGHSVVIMTVGRGSMGAYTTLKTKTAAIETVTSVPGLEAAAFSVSKGGLVRGVTAITGAGELIVVESSLTQAQDEALIEAVAKL